MSMQRSSSKIPNSSWKLSTPAVVLVNRAGFLLVPVAELVVESAYASILELLRVRRKRASTRDFESQKKDFSDTLAVLMALRLFPDPHSSAKLTFQIKMTKHVFLPRIVQIRKETPVFKKPE